MLDSYRDLIEELLETPRLLRELVGERAATDLPPALLPLIVELRDRDRTVLGRVQALLREPDAFLPRLDSVEATADGLEPESLLNEFDTARGDLVSLLMNLALKDWERTGTHEIDGEITLADEIERHVEYDEAHVARIREL